MGAGPRAGAALAEVMGHLRVDDNVAHNTAGVRFVGDGADAPILELTRPTLKKFEEQLYYLRASADLRFDRQAEIESQVGDLTPFFGALSHLSADRCKWTLELLSLLFSTCRLCQYRLKQLMDCPRPISFAQEVQPMIQTPGHPTWPSGHATESFAAATLLARLTDGSYADPVQGVQDQLPTYRLAARISLNRQVAGVHFPTDSVAGAALGIALAEFLINYSSGAAQTQCTNFNGGSFDGDFNLTLLGQTMPGGGDNEAITRTAVPIPGAGRSKLLKKLWDHAAEEWA